MGNRACPLCFARVPRTLVLTCGEALVCPSCHAPLELSRSSRVLSSLDGLLGGFIAAQIVLRVATTGRWVLPMLGAILTFSLVSTLVLFFLSDLVVLPKPPASHFPLPHK
jgi:hypothetical protein